MDDEQQTTPGSGGIDARRRSSIIVVGCLYAIELFQIACIEQRIVKADTNASKTGVVR